MKNNLNYNQNINVFSNDISYQNNMYPNIMLDETPQQKNNIYQQNFNNNNNNNFDKDKKVSTFGLDTQNQVEQQNQQNNIFSLLNSFQNNGNPLSSLLPLLLQNNFSQTNIMDTVGKLPQFSGQNGANLINILSNITNKKESQIENKIEKYKVIKELD